MGEISLVNLVAITVSLSVFDGGIACSKENDEHVEGALGGNSYNSSSGTNYVNANEGEKVKIRCPASGNSETVICQNVPRKESGNFTYRFKVLPEHNSCNISCRMVNGSSCTVHLTLNVTKLMIVSTVPSESSTSALMYVPPSVYTLSQQPYNKYYPKGGKDNDGQDQSPSFPVIISVCILVVLLVGILFGVCLYMYASRWKYNSSPNKAEDVVIASNDTTIPIALPYSAVNKSPQIFTTGKVVLTELDRQCDDDAYAEVNGARRQISSNELIKGVKAETSVTKDYYSVVDIPTSTMLRSADTPNEGDSAIYAEVDKNDKQSEEKENTVASSCDSSVSDAQSRHAPNQPGMSKYYHVGKVSTSSALYAVVEKEQV